MIQAYFDIFQKTSLGRKKYAKTTKGFLIKLPNENLFWQNLCREQGGKTKVVD